MMTTFEYQILRFMPDRVNGEFINLGVVVFNSAQQEIRVHFADRVSRISEVFSGINGRYISKLIQTIQSDLENIALQINSNKLRLESYPTIDELNRKALPKDDSSLFFSATEKALDINIDACADYLFDRMVSLHHSEEEKEIKHDKDLWSKVYKKYFEKEGITANLRHHTINTKFSTIEFEHAWKNGHWNFFEPVNFDLNQSESIRKKVLRWIGEIDQLSTADEPSHLYLLTRLSEKHSEMNSFIREYLSSKTNPKVKVEIVTAANAEKVAAELKKEIELHEDRN